MTSYLEYKLLGVKKSNRPKNSRKNGIEIDKFGI